MRERAGEWNLDLSRVTGISHSAGGHLILWLAPRSRLPDDSPLRVSDPRVIKGVVVSNGLADLEASRSVTLPSCLDAVYDQPTGPASPERPDPLSDNSPARLFPVGVPFVNVNASEGRVAPPMLGEALTRKAEAAGDSAALVIIPATGHVEPVSPGTEAFDIQSQILSDFIARKPG